MPDPKIYYDEVKDNVLLEEGPQKISAFSSFSLGVNSGGSILPTSSPAVSRFGGTGTDGNLIISSGTTTIDLGSAKIVEKNYQLVNIASGATLTFSNANAQGTVIILRCLGDFICSGTITADAFGADGGAGGGVGGGGAGGGAGGASTTANGTNGQTGSGAATAGTAGVTSNWIGQATGGDGGTIAGGPTPKGGVGPSHLSTASQYARFLIIPGSGGGGGTGNTNAGGTGGKGGGALYIEVNNSLYFYGTITAKGANGVDGNLSGGGGGGGGGSVIILYKNLSVNSGTITVTGGSGGAGGAAGAGGGGFSLVAANTLFS